MCELVAQRANLLATFEKKNAAYADATRAKLDEIRAELQWQVLAEDRHKAAMEVMMGDVPQIVGEEELNERATVGTAAVAADAVPNIAGVTVMRYDDAVALVEEGTPCADVDDIGDVRCADSGTPPLLSELAKWALWAVAAEEWQSVMLEVRQVHIIRVFLASVGDVGSLDGTVARGFDKVFACADAHAFESEQFGRMVGGPNGGAGAPRTTARPSQARPQVCRRRPLPCLW
jgi:hypothetical protein